MAKDNKVMTRFLEAIPDEKLSVKGLSSEVKLWRDYHANYRLDHQGLNDDKNEHPFIHRLYIQPIGKGAKGHSKKSKSQLGDSSAVVARCHASDEATPNQIRQALLNSFVSAEDAKLFYAPPKTK